jgi:hypothetical protein
MRVLIAFLALVVVAGALLLAGCSPSIERLQRDEQAAKLIERLASDNVTDRMEAAVALGELCLRYSPDSLLKDGTRCGDLATPLIGALEDPHLPVRYAAMRSLGSLGRNAYEQDSALYARIADALVEGLLAPDASGGDAASALATIKWEPEPGEAGARYYASRGQWDECARMGPEAAPLLAEALARPNRTTEMIHAAGDLCARLEDGDLCAPLAAPLVAALRTGQAASAAYALATVSRGLSADAARAEIVGAMGAALERLDPAAPSGGYNDVLAALGQARDAGAIPLLVAALPVQTRCDAELALAQLCGDLDDASLCEQAMEPLGARLAGDCGGRARDALGSIGPRLADATARARVAELLAADLAERCRARSSGASSTALASLGSDAIQPLKALLSESEPRCQGLAIEGLAALGPILPEGRQRNEVSQILSQLLAFPDLRLQASNALVAFHREEVPRLLAFLRSPATLYIYRGLITYGVNEAEEALVEALQRFGDKTMALDYVNSGNEALGAAGRAWAKDNGYIIIPMPGSGGGPAWGSRK